jgi:DNA invertase Pin-like site-specific DNA recombinase
MPIRCAIYARYSSDQQRPESLADQIRHCRQEATRHPEWVILDRHIYTDQALSGASVEGREGLQRLVQAALRRPQPFDLILVDDTSRLARDVVDSVRHFRELRAHGVDLYFVNQGLHSARDNAEFLLAIYGAMDSEYIRELGRKTHRGLEGQARKGWSAGGIAYGYRREPVYDATQTDRDGQPRRVGVRWILDPDEADIVRRIFRWYADGVGMGTIAARLNAQAVPSPRQAKGHRARHDGVGAGWDLSAVRVILINELYRGRLIWNRSHWTRLPGTRRRRRQLRPASEWVVVDRPDLRIVDESLWHHAQTRRAGIRARYVHPSQFGRSRTEYGAHLLSGRLVCGECGGSLTIRTGKPSRYGCTRHWRRGPAACSNNVLVRRDLAEQKIAELLQAKLYTPAGVQRLVEAVNARLRAVRPAAATQRERLTGQLTEVRRRLDGLRRFVEQGDTSTKVRAWLGDAEAEEQRLEQEVERLGAQDRRPPIQIHPGRVERYLRDLRETLLKAEARARQLLQADVERIVIHPVRSDATKPFARAEVVTTGKGLLARVAFVVAGARFELWMRPELGFDIFLSY